MLLKPLFHKKSLKTNDLSKNIIFKSSRDAAKLAPLANMQGGICTPFSNLGQKRPKSLRLFLCPSKIKAALVRLKFVMVGCSGQPLWLAVPKFGSANPLQSATQRFAPLLGGLHPQNLGVPL